MVTRHTHVAVLVGDARTVLSSLPAGSVDTCITSPPYFLVRDYLADGQLGLEHARGDGATF